jgi:hypothetical protein
MRFYIQQSSDSSFDFETFNAEGYRDEKRSHILDAMKHADNMGYSSSPWFSTPFLLITEEGEEYEVVNPRTHPDWVDEMAKDVAFLPH